MTDNKTTITLRNGSEILVPDYMHKIVLDSFNNGEYIRVTLTINDKEYIVSEDDVIEVNQTSKRFL